MKKYFYINDYYYNDDKTQLEKICGYYTDADHKNIFPSLQISREEVLGLIKTGNSLFIHDGCYRKVLLKVVEVENLEFLRVDSHPHPIDYLG